MPRRIYRAANSLEWIAYARTQGGTDFRSQPYLAPDVFKRQIHKREVPAVTLLKLTDVAALPWHEQPERLFD
ncbi:hypothetical protein EYF88_08805 [Paracoccus sediminis]|uniref:Uncharacterized protein n=1 Tax=Paracoccus sediminis TaxID=1214787 RepID=A0A238WD17_9RHOB|nr:hypothetical protein [Paracoccus sediminis]TBN50989.1 hypothetical protein EYF88_08805 [Paracoccus sediminis]SNR43589.1 hypothetical protein SAMN06265378_10421 [Paracoccus sediminis]